MLFTVVPGSGYFDYYPSQRRLGTFNDLPAVGHTSTPSNVTVDIRSPRQKDLGDCRAIGCRSACKIFHPISKERVDGSPRSI